MNIDGQEIQALMPERRNISNAGLIDHKACGYNEALAEVEAVLPQMLALAEQRGAEGERERCVGIVGNILSIKPAPTQLFTKIAYEINNPEAQEATQTLTQPPHE